MGKTRAIRSMGYFVAIPGVNVLAAVLILPAVTGRFSVGGLAALGVGQSLGAAASALSELGWGVMGPQRVARADDRERALLYEAAMATRLAVGTLLAPLAAVAAYFLVPEQRADAAAIAFAFTFLALSPSWFLIGCDRPLAILAIDVVPRLLLSALAALAIMLGAPLIAYAAAILLSVIVTAVLASSILGMRLVPRARALRRGLRLLRTFVPLTLGRAVITVYTSLPVALVALVAPDATATFTAIDRLVRMAQSALTGIPNKLQSWVGRASDQERRGRSQRAVLVTAAVAAPSAAAFVLVVPLVSPLLFANSVTVGWELAALGGMALMLFTVSRGLVLALVAEGLANYIALANLGAAVFGASAIYLLARPLGALGGVAGVLVAEITAMVTMCLVLVVASRKGSGRRGGVPPLGPSVPDGSTGGGAPAKAEEDRVQHEQNAVLS